MSRRIVSFHFLFFAVMVLQSALSAAAHATLKLYYDPATGNVAFDTTETRNGTINNYFFEINDASSSWFFRPENLIRLSSGTLYTADPTLIGDSTLATPWQGLYTIGNVFPAGLSEEVWSSFVHSNYHQGLLNYGYNDVIGGGQAPDAEFIYGPPLGEFDNKWDLVDPDTLAWATTATLVYRAWSGEVLIDTTGGTSGYIAGFRLVTDNQILSDQFVPFLDTPLSGVYEGTAYLFADAIEPGIYSIGKILPSGLTSSQFAAMFEEADFLARAGFQGGSFDFDADGMAMTLHFVPEPSSLLLLGAGVMCGVSRLRRIATASSVAA